MLNVENTAIPNSTLKKRAVNASKRGKGTKGKKPNSKQKGGRKTLRNRRRNMKH